MINTYMHTYTAKLFKLLKSLTVYNILVAFSK